MPRKAFTESGTLQNKCDLPRQRLKLAAQKTPVRRKCMKGHGNKKKRRRTSLSVQWLRLLAYNAGGMHSIPGQGTKIPHMLRGTAKKRKKDMACQGNNQSLRFTRARKSGNVAGKNIPRLGYYGKKFGLYGRITGYMSAGMRHVQSFFKNSL